MGLRRAKISIIGAGNVGATAARVEARAERLGTGAAGLDPREAARERPRRAARDGLGHGVDVGRARDHAQR